jgi:replicative DNA helicase
MVGGGTKQGKTTLTLNVADNVAQQGKHVLYFSFESSRKELMQKLISKRCLLDSEKFVYFEGPLQDEELEGVKRAQEEISGLPLIIDTGKPDPERVIKRAEGMKLIHPDLSLIIFDGLQSFDAYSEYRNNKSHNYYELLKALRSRLAVDLDTMVMVNGQVKQKVLQRKNKKPTSIEEFADCKGIPEVADTAFFMYRPEEYWPDVEEFQGWASVIPVAMRVGKPAGRQFRMYIDPSTSRLSEEPFNQ